jgi:hypothetical protein
VTKYFMSLTKLNEMMKSFNPKSFKEFELIRGHVLYQSRN